MRQVLTDGCGNQGRAAEERRERQRGASGVEPRATHGAFLTPTPNSVYRVRGIHALRAHPLIEWQ